MSPDRYQRETRRGARAICRALGQDPDAMVIPTAEVFARMRGGDLAPAVRTPAWRAHETQMACILDGMLADPRCAEALADPGKIKWRFTTETTA